ncbi:MAG: sensor histidine kinase [Oceanospirillaceae bacterium]|nr:sensor histidine kinase [Oceanospirillaceae bacterium]MCP5335386.1 sensor histidine kinase [Oceanospirillaceae bacterium]MCP5351443.1 sensor histidine kinase [Oceanospirillaceae bacterium]
MVVVPLLKRVLLALYWGLLCAPALAAQMPPAAPQYILEQPGMPLTLQQVMQRNDWQQSQGNLNFGYRSEGLWLRQNVSMAPSESRFLQISYPLLDDIQLFWLQGENILQQYHTGDGQIYASRPVASNNFVFRFNGAAGGAYDLYLRVQTSGTLTVPMHWYGDTQYQSLSDLHAMLFGAFYGVLLIMLLYNLFLFLAIRDVVYFYYVLTVGSILALQWVYDGHAFAWFWPDQPAINNWIFPIVYCVNQLMMLTFIANFLHVKMTSTWFTRTFFVLRAAVLLLLGAAFLVPYHKVMPLVLLMGMVGLGTGLFAGFRLWFKGYSAARYFTIAWVLFACGIIMTTLKGLGLLPDNNFTNYGYMLGSVCEVLLLSFALADRIESARLAKQQAEQEVQTARAENIKNLQRYQELYENAAVGNFQGNMHYQLIKVNKTFARILGYATAEEFMREVQDSRDVLLTPLPLFEKMLADMQREKVLSDRELLLKDRNGEPRWVSITLRQVNMDGHNLIEGSMIDITARKQAELVNQHLEQERLEGLEQLSLGVAREINTPLGSNVVTSAFLEDSMNNLMALYEGARDNPELNKFAKLLRQSLQLITQNQKKVTRIVRRFREVSVSELGATRQLFDLDKSLQEFIADERWDMAGWRIDCACPAGIVLNSYPTALRQILSQLMENSRIHGKQDQQSSPAVAIEVRELDNGWISLAYSDNGPGIADTLLNKLGQPFFSTLRGPNGRVGLGLFMVKNLTSRLLKGQVVYASHMHAGFHVVLEIPRDVQA